MELFLVFFSFFVIFVFYIFIYLGGLYEIKFQKTKFPGTKILYTPVKGPYNQSSKYMDLIYYSLKDSGITTYKGIGVYFDDPKKTNSRDLRSIVGCIIEEKDYNKIDKIIFENDVQLIDLEENNNIISTEFPYKSKLSVVFSIFRVYPKISEYLKKENINKNVDIMEIYDVPNKIINYNIFDEKFFEKIKKENF